MITALVTIAVAICSFILGWKMRGSENNIDAVVNSLETTEKLREIFTTELIYDCPREDCSAVSGVLCSTPMGMHPERIEYASEMEEPLYDYELSHNQQPDEPGLWMEVEIQNECGHGCKIYEHKQTGRRILWHNSAYGCRR